MPTETALDRILATQDIILVHDKHVPIPIMLEFQDKGFYHHTTLLHEFWNEKGLLSLMRDIFQVAPTDVASMVSQIATAELPHKKTVEIFEGYDPFTKRNPALSKAFFGALAKRAAQRRPGERFVVIIQTKEEKLRLE